MLLRPDRILLRVPSLPAAVRYYRECLGLTLVKQDPRIALLRFPQGQTEIVLHTDPGLPADAVYYLVDDVRDLFARRAELKLNFIQPPTPATRGHRAAIKDPFGNVLLLLDRSAADDSDKIVEDAKPPGALFAGIAPKIAVNRQALIRIYQSIGRTADDLPYTPDFERLYTTYAAEFRDQRPSKEDTWRHLLNIRKAGKLPKLGDARSKPPDLSDDQKQLLRALLGDAIGKRDRLPYTKRFDELVDRFNKSQPRPLSPNLVWRLVATLAK